VNTKRIIDEIRAGNLVITPTDTVYGIMADAMNAEAVERVYQAKQRSKGKPLMILVSDMEMALQYVETPKELERAIMRKYWPGKLTILLKKNNEVVGAVTNNNYVGVRVPDNAELREIIREIGRPLVSTSANLSNKLTVTNPDLLEPEVLRYISYVENAGTVESAPSSIIKVENGEIEVVREGDVAREVIVDERLKCEVSE